MTQLCRNIHKLFFILPFLLVGCNKLSKEACDAKCQKCIADCYKECQEYFNSCVKTISPGNKGAAENCIYYGNQCLQLCPTKCMSLDKKG